MGIRGIMGECRGVEGEIMNYISNQRGFLPVLIMVAVIIVFLAGSAIFFLEKTGFIRSGAAAHEQGLTNRAEIRAADKQSARESFQQNLILVIESGRQMLFTGFFFMGVLGFAFFAFAFTRESNRHHERMMVMQIQAAVQAARGNSPALSAADHPAGHSDQDYYHSGVAYTLVCSDESGRS